jgi:DNA-binding MarR family transcriptional regulator
MVVKSEASVDPAQLDLAYVAFFLGLRVNEVVAERLTDAGFAGVRQSHGYVVQHLIEQDRTITGLAGRMGVTQQAASKTVAEMVRLGILEFAASPDRRAKFVRLSARGRESVHLARRIRRRLDGRLLRKLGPDRYAAAKSTLLEALDALGPLDWIVSRRVPAPR